MSGVEQETEEEQVAERYLTSEEKEAVLAEGYRDLDPGLRPWLNRINALPGMVTVQSCGGHRKSELMTSGHLWVRLTEEATSRFEEVALDLAAHDCIEDVGRHYKDWGQEVLEITFQGAERGRLQESQQVIADSLARCAG